VDIRRLPGTDVRCDIAQPLPFRDSAFDSVVADHVLEHVAGRPKRYLDEIHRVCKPGARVEIGVPHWRHYFAHSLDHVKTWTHCAFSERENFITVGLFKQERVEFQLFDNRVWLRRWERLGRFLCKHTGLVSGLRFYLRAV
jgi:SAM-dependent methyltransferase